MKTIKVVYIADSSLSYPAGGRTRIASEARCSKSPDILINILCFIPIKEFISYKITIIARKGLENETGARVYYIPRLPLRRFFLIECVNNWFCGLSVFLFCLLSKTKIAHIQGSPKFLIPMGYMNDRWNGTKIKFIIDIHGAAAEEYMYSKRLTHKDKRVLLIEKYEKSAFEKADWAIFVSRALRNYYVKKYNIKVNNSCIIPCATQAKFNISEERRDMWRKKYGLRDKIVFCYNGSIRAYQMIEETCRLFKAISNFFPDSFFLIFTYDRDNFVKYLKAAGIEGVYFKILSVEHEYIFDMLQMGDIGFLLRADSVINHVSSPTKFSEYCACGLPVIITGYVGDFSDLVLRYRLGLIINADAITVSEELKNFIVDVKKHRAEYGRRCSDIAKQNLSWDTYGPLLNDLYKKLSNNEINFN